VVTIFNTADRVETKAPFRPADRQVLNFEVGGKRLCYDANSMTLAPGGALGESLPASSFRPDFPHPDARDGVRRVVLYLTRRCNLRCSYCFVHDTDDGSCPRMASATARRALELLLPAQRPVTIAFFGGEPLLEWNLLTEVVELAKHAYRGPGRPGFEITTNGTLLDADKVAFLDREGFTMTVSLDGPRDVHNHSRPAREGHSYEATLRGLRLLKGRRLAARTTLRATFTAAEPRLLERLQHHHGLIDQGLCAHVAVEPASPFDGEGADWDAIGREYEQAARYLRDRVRQRRKASFEDLVRFVRRIAFRRPACCQCEAGSGYVSVATDGTVHACHREGPSRIGDLAAGGLDESLRAPWLDNRFYLCPKCMACSIRLVCGGPCRLDALEHGDLREPVEAGCKLRWTWFHWAAWLLAELPRDEAARLTGHRASTCCGQKG